MANVFASFDMRCLSEYPLQRPLAHNGPQRALPSNAPDRSRIKLLLVRHAESEANVDPMVHTQLSDHSIPLSAKGREDALACGNFLSTYLSSQSPQDVSQRRIVVSPYKRARETAAAITQKAGQFIGDLSESVLAGEQQFGLFEGLPVESIAEKFPLENLYFEKAIASGGRFWARPPLGESRFDVCVRASSIIDMILRDEHYFGISTVVIVSHGITLRALAMMWLGRTPEWFESEANPANCSIRLLDGVRDCGYIYSGFSGTRNAGPRTAAPPKEAEGKKDVLAEEDPVAYTQRTMSSASSAIISKQNLSKRLAELEAELAEIKAALRAGW